MYLLRVLYNLRYIFWVLNEMSSGKKVSQKCFSEVTSYKIHALQDQPFTERTFFQTKDLIKWVQTQAKT